MKTHILLATIFGALTLFATPVHAEESRCWNVDDPRWNGAPVVPGAKISAPIDLLKFGGRPTIIAGAKFAGASFASLHLRNICFLGGDMKGTNWRRARLEHVAFNDSNLTGADFGKARVAKSIFLGADLVRVNASDADFSQSFIHGGNLKDANFTRTKLTSFRLRCEKTNELWWALCDDSYAFKVNARGADLSHARFEIETMIDWNLRGARLDHTQLRMSTVAAFRQGNVRGPVTIVASGYANDVRATLRPDEWRGLASALSRDAHLMRWENDGLPSFDCKKASSGMERFLCTPGQYGSLPSAASSDWELDRVYKEALAFGVTTTQEERKWLQSRDLCLSETEDKKEVCISGRYASRISELKARMSEVQFLRPGQSALYVDISLPVPDAYKATATYQRLLPVLIASAGTVVAVKRVDRNTLRVNARASGANLHTCDLVDRPLDYDSRSGKFGGRDSQGSYYPVGTLFGRHVILTEESNAILSVCGARAHWNEAEAIKVPREMVDSLFGQGKDDLSWRAGIVARGK